LGIDLAPASVWNILERHGLDPVGAENLIQAPHQGLSAAVQTALGQGRLRNRLVALRRRLPGQAVRMAFSAPTASSFAPA
jgi:hypothetical protein